MKLDTLVRELEYSFVTISPLHVGGERGVHPSLVDLKVERRVEIVDGRVREVVVVPGSTIKGVMRHTFEDLLRLKVFEELSKSSAGQSGRPTPLLEVVVEALSWVVEGLKELFGWGREKAIEFLARLLSREQQFLSEDTMALLLRDGHTASQCVDLVGGELGNRLAGVEGRVVRKLAYMVCATLPSLYPLVCDPTSPSTSCIPDISLVEVARDRGVAARFLLNIALARKAPLVVEVCPVCLLFGAPGRSSPLRFLDAKPDNLDLKVLPLQTRVSIDRYTLAAKRGKLYTLEYVPAGTVFRGKIRVVTPLLHPIYANNIDNLLKYLLRMAGERMIGGLKSTGMGLVYVEDPSTTNPVDELFNRFVELLREAVKRKHLEQVKEVIEEKLVAYGLDKEDAEKTVKAIDAVFESYKKIVEKLKRS